MLKGQVAMKQSMKLYHEAMARTELVDERRANGVDEETNKRIDILMPQIPQLQPHSIGNK